jgi:hypothetical protein
LSPFSHDEIDLHIVRVQQQRQCVDKLELPRVDLLLNRVLNPVSQSSKSPGKNGLNRPGSTGDCLT